MMTDLTQMAESLKTTSEQDWQPEDNAWVSEEMAQEIEKLNLMARMHEGDD
jgi:hypothetical protein